MGTAYGFGTCPGTITVTVILVIRGVGERPALTGDRRHRTQRLPGRVLDEMRGLLIRHGAVSNRGGAIINRGTPAVNNSLVPHSTAGHGYGGNLRGAIEVAAGA